MPDQISFDEAVAAEAIAEAMEGAAADMPTSSALRALALRGSEHWRNLALNRRRHLVLQGAPVSILEPRSSTRLPSQDGTVVPLRRLR